MITGTRGQLAIDFIIVVAVIFAVAFTGIIVAMLWGKVNTALQGNPVIANDANASAASTGVDTNFNAGLNIGFVVALAICYIGFFFTAQYLAVNPTLFFINVFAYILVIGLGAVFANVFDAATNNTTFAATRASEPIVVFVMNHLLAFSIVGVFIALIGFYAKPAEAGGY